MEIVILDAQVANPGDMSWDGLAALGNLAVYPRTAPGEIVERASRADAVFVNKVVLDADTLAALPRLRFIGVLATGYNNVDIAAARARGITVCNVPSYSSDSVAQLVFAMLLAIVCRVETYSASVERGDWGSCPDFSYTLGPVTELDGKTIGIYGLGNIGMRVAAIARAFGMRVISPTSRPAESLPEYIEKVDFAGMLAQSDVISVNAPLTPSNRGIFNAGAFAAMKRGVIFINTARGPLVDEAALSAALREGHVGAAAVDVLAEEPPRSGSPLIGAPRCLVTPHIAWQSVEARRRLIDISAGNLRLFLAGTPQNVVS